jgi:hypothetical protein
LRQVPAQHVGIRTSALEEHGRTFGPQVGDRRMAIAEGIPRFEQQRRTAPRFVDDRAAAVDEIHRLVRRFVGELHDMREALARVRHFVTRKFVETRFCAETRKRGLRRRREAAELGQQARIHLFGQRFERATECGAVAGIERGLQCGNLRAVALRIRNRIRR